MAKQETSELRLMLNKELIDKLKIEATKNKYAPRTMSSIVREALDLYFSTPVKSGVARFNELEYITAKDIQEKGLRLDDLVKTVPDEEIHAAMSLSGEIPTSDIRPGPGVAHRLQILGIRPLDVIKARRSKAAGREYNKELEQYFDLL
jgi:hypothetical protein